MSKNQLNDAIEQVVNEKASAKNTSSENYINELKERIIGERTNGDISELTELVNLIVITHQEMTLLRSDMWSFISRFIVKPNAMNGNGRRFIKHFPQVGTNWDAVKDKFIPDGLSKTAFKVQFIKFKNDDGTVATGSYQLAFNATYSVADMITYFINGQLSEFIAEEILGKISQSIDITLYNIIMTEIVKPTGKQVTGSAKNLFDALVTEVFPNCAEMLQNSADFNVNQDLINAIDASSKNDLVMIMSPKTKSNIDSYLMSQLFNAAKIELTNYVGEVHIANRKFESDTKGLWKTATTSYVDDNTIIVIDTANYYKFMEMLEFTGEQDYPLNMSKLRVSHLWYAGGKLEWGKAFFYTNSNLTVMPSQE